MGDDEQRSVTCENPDGDESEHIDGVNPKKLDSNENAVIASLIQIDGRCSSTTSDHRVKTNERNRHVWICLYIRAFRPTMSLRSAPPIRSHMKTGLKSIETNKPAEIRPDPHPLNHSSY